MVQTCCVPLCSSRAEKGSTVKFFSFPKDEELKKKWLKAIPRKDFVPSQYSKVCDTHFEACDIISVAKYINPETGQTLSCTLDRKRPAPGAIPKIFDYTKIKKKKENIGDGSGSGSDSDDSEQFCCSVPNCWNKPNLNISTYPFPEHPQLQKKWLNVFPVPHFKPTKESSVCQRHFLQTDFTLTKDGKISELLNPTAIPSVFTNVHEQNHEEFDLPFSEDDMMQQDPFADDESDIEVLATIEVTGLNFELLLRNLANQGLPPSWKYLIEKKVVFVYNLEAKENLSVKYSLRIDCDLLINVFVRNVQISNIDFYNIPKKLTSYNDLLEILRKIPIIYQNLKDTKAHNQDVVEQIVKIANNIQTNENKSLINFVLEQLRFSICPRNEIKFPNSVVIFTAKLHSICEKSVEYIRSCGFLILPDVLSKRKNYIIK